MIRYQCKTYVRLIVFLTILLLNKFIYAETIFIFHPEGKSSQIQTVKTDLTNYFKMINVNAEFYFFAKREDFDRSVERFDPELAIVSSYYYYEMKENYNWKEILSGYNNEKKSYKKVLVSFKNLNDFRQLKNNSLASVQLDTASLNTYMRMIGVSQSEIRIVSVSKDIDAIMALGFEQVQGAIVTRSSFNQIENINPDATENLKILLELSETEHPKVVMFPKLKKIKIYKISFANINKDKQNISILRYFGITDFK